METVTFKIETQMQFYRVTSLLEEIGIPYSFKKYEDSSLPFLGQTRVYADLSVPEEHKETVGKLISEKIADDTELL